MLNEHHIETAVRETVTALLHEVRDGDGEMPAVDATSTFPDLGIDSLLLARLLIELEDELGIDPFESDDVSVADLRNVGDLVRVFGQARRAA